MSRTVVLCQECRRFYQEGTTCACHERVRARDVARRALQVWRLPLRGLRAVRHPGTRLRTAVQNVRQRSHRALP